MKFISNTLEREFLPIIMMIGINLTKQELSQFIRLVAMEQRHSFFELIVDTFAERQLCREWRKHRLKSAQN